MVLEILLEHGSASANMDGMYAAQMEAEMPLRVLQAQRPLCEDYQEKAKVNCIYEYTLRSENSLSVPSETCPSE